jgi:hypothetical protein
MHVQFSEEATEREMLLRRDVLVAKKYDDVLGQRPMDFVHRAIG